jgi:hypothetical protein
MKHVMSFDVYLGILLMVSMCLIKYRWLRSGHRIKNGIFGPGPILEPGPWGHWDQHPGTRIRGPGLVSGDEWGAYYTGPGLRKDESPLNSWGGL